jgi:diketogulonate reductase-like aldo/keto reductase
MRARLGQAARGTPPDHARRRAAVAALRDGLDLGITVIDTDRDGEELVADAISRRRDEAYLVGRLRPGDRMVQACERSLRRLQTDHIDLYLLHGRGRVQLDATADGFAELQAAGLIREWGVADFTMTQLAELLTLTTGCAAEEVRYDLQCRAAEYDVLEGCRSHGLKLLAYSDLKLRAHPRLGELAQRHHVTPAQLELAWLLSHEGVVAIVPAETPELAAEHHAAAKLELDGHDFAMLDDAFPPPLGPQPLDPL